MNLKKLKNAAWSLSVLMSWTIIYLELQCFILSFFFLHYLKSHQESSGIESWKSNFPQGHHQKLIILLNHFPDFEVHYLRADKPEAFSIFSVNIMNVNKNINFPWYIFFAYTCFWGHDFLLCRFEMHINFELFKENRFSIRYIKFE